MSTSSSSSPSPGTAAPTAAVVPPFVESSTVPTEGVGLLAGAGRPLVGPGPTLRQIRALCADLSSRNKLGPAVAMALLLIEEAAEIGALLSLVEATGAQLVDAENIHQEIAGARRLVAGLASRGFRGLSLPEGDVVALIDRIIRDGRAAYGVATDDAARQEVVRAAAAAIFGICGQQPAPEAVERALSTVRARGRPRKGTSTSGTTGHYPLLIAVLRSIGFPETTLPASVKRTRGRSTERAHNRGGHQT